MTGVIRVAADLLPEPGTRRLIRGDQECIVLLNVDGQLFAINDDCPHSMGSLLGGKLDGLLLQCPAHGLRFDLRDGCMRGGSMRARCYPVVRGEDHALIYLNATSH